MAWWRAALATAFQRVEETRQQWDWPWIKSRSENRQKYIDLYLKHLNFQEDDKMVVLMAFMIYCI
jgi:hypothetical protein